MRISPRFRGALWGIAIAMRLLYHSPRRVQQQLRRDARRMRGQLQGLLRRHRVTRIPRRATGPSGLIRALGLPDSSAIDGFGGTLSTDRVGFLSNGMDGRDGTRDDF